MENIFSCKLKVEESETLSLNFLLSLKMASSGEEWKLVGDGNSDDWSLAFNNNRPRILKIWLTMGQKESQLWAKWALVARF
jgi:hypothetical protein